MLLLVFPHPLSRVLVTALHSIPANYPHELLRTKTAQYRGTEAGRQPWTPSRDGRHTSLQISIVRVFHINAMRHSKNIQKGR